MPLTQDKIAQLYANRRVKGLFEEKLTEVYHNSDELGFDPYEDWPMEFAPTVMVPKLNPDTNQPTGEFDQVTTRKSPTSVYQGFRNAAEKMGIADDVDVVQREGSVFVLIKSRCLLAAPVASSNGNHPTEVSESTTDTDSE
jgi:hypothetical protein